MKESTLAIHGGIDGDETTGAVNVPIYQTSTYRQRALGETTGWEYSRTGNPTRAALEKLVADLEGGSHGFAFGSGMAAIAAVLSLFRSGDRILLSKNVYGGTFRILDKVFNSFGLTYSLEDTDDIAALEKAVTPDVKALLVETPANPLLAVTNLKAVAALAKRHGILLVVDNTFMTPYLQKPLVLGADIVVHSATKYLGGHSDLVAGLVVTNRADIAERLGFIQNATGGVLGPFDSFLLIRGIKTLAVRMDRHVANAETLARRLQAHPDVSHVWYPSLDGFPGRDIQLSQAKNGGAMISFELAAGRNHRRFFSALKLVTLAESLGGVESLVCHPASMTHASIPKETREKIGITDRLIRLSVGIEDVDDIWVDVQRAITEA
ncbi:MAG: aminotransferase class I/II-fold pyridoxal phosphate-dependent enzyme [Kiritimatiellae bacterium]|nr:aminotransferase class I/II-fold pyridoxal phosphate-dependent enzyme [Kiritimatiellia bacterium]